MQKVEIKEVKIDLLKLQRVKNSFKLFLARKKKNKEKAIRKSKNEHFIDIVYRAKIDLEQSKNFFANVTDPDLIDYATHKILANQSFYAYLIKKAKAENITFDI